MVAVDEIQSCSNQKLARLIQERATVSTLSALETPQSVQGRTLVATCEGEETTSPSEVQPAAVDTLAPSSTGESDGGLHVKIGLTTMTGVVEGWASWPLDFVAGVFVALCLLAKAPNSILAVVLAVLAVVVVAVSLRRVSQRGGLLVPSASIA